MIINMIEMYTGIRAIDQRGSGLSNFSILFCAVSLDMVLMYDFQN